MPALGDTMSLSCICDQTLVLWTRVYYIHPPTYIQYCCYHYYCDKVQVGSNKGSGRCHVTSWPYTQWLVAYSGELTWTILFLIDHIEISMTKVHVLLTYSALFLLFSDWILYL